MTFARPASAHNAPAVILTCLAGFAGPAAADEPTVVAFAVQAVAEAGSATFQAVLVPPGASFQWTLGGPTALLDDKTGAPIATLADAGAFYQLGDDSSQVLLWFSLESAVPLNVTIGSDLVDFNMMPSAQGVASVGMTLTDGNGDGASVSGLAAGGSCSSYWFNGAAPQGQLFLEAIPGLAAAPGMSSSSAQGTGGFLPLPDAVGDMSLLFSFTLSPGDLVSGTSNYLVESVESVSDPCPADINDDGVVDVIDLVAVLVNWGGDSGNADVTHDGIVNVDDLLAIAMGWGVCPP
jgi:hypothetical protein